MSPLREKILEAIVKKSTLKQQIFDNTCRIELSVRLSKEAALMGKMKDVSGISIIIKNSEE